MSYQPQVGDRVTDDHNDDEGTVLFVHGKQAVVQFDDEHGVGLYLFSDLTKVEPRPKVREQTIIVARDGYDIGFTETAPNARIVAKTWQELEDIERSGISRIAVVCDPDGEPLEVQT